MSPTALAVLPEQPLRLQVRTMDEELQTQKEGSK